MDALFLANNSHWHDPARFQETDPNLIRLHQQPLVYEHALLNKLPVTIPGIYTLGGGRQIGKSTLLKQWMQKLLEASVEPRSIAFISGELIDDQSALLRIIQSLLSEMTGELKYLIIDEVTYIKNWDKAIKYAADIQLFHDVVVILTGSDLALMKQARMTFPGRRGKAKQVNFHLYPLSFREYFSLVSDIDADSLLEKKQAISEDDMTSLYEKFQNYLIHGGFLTAINDYARDGKILESTLITYSEWIRGDVLKRGKSETYLKEIVEALVLRYGAQLTWNSIADALSIDHPNTVADYCQLLASMDAVFIQSALLEDKLAAAPKKARKIVFMDPFIFHAVRYWLSPVDDPYQNQIHKAVDDPALSSKLVEACVATQYKRFYKTYYIKAAAGEVDVAYVDDKQFWPLEVKWRNQLRSKDVKQVMKYKNAKILSRSFEFEKMGDIPVEPLPLDLLSLGGEILID